MKTILATAYAVNPYKGSEDGTGWNWVCQIAHDNKVIAVTRKNNREPIEKYMQENPQDFYANMEFLYYDLPYWMRFWKKKERGAMLYYYMWQLFMPFFLKMKKAKFDIAHNLNFHNDWAPSLLWTLGKPMVWGPIGHHPKTPKKYLLPIYGKKAYIKQRITWVLKQLFWHVDPLLKLTVAKSDQIIGINSSVSKVLGISEKRVAIMPAVASEEINLSKSQPKEKFYVLSIGRFVPLKGFDLTIASFAKFYHQLSPSKQKMVVLKLVGKGPKRAFLEGLAKELNVAEAVEFIEWMPRESLVKLYQDSDVFLFPSHEGAGMVIPEALSYGLPIICMDNCGPGEFINESCGLKIPYTEYDQSIRLLAHQLLKVYNDDSFRQELAEGAIHHFNTHFKWEHKRKLLNGVYELVGSSLSIRAQEKSVSVLDGQPSSLALNTTNKLTN